MCKLSLRRNGRPNSPLIRQKHIKWSKNIWCLTVISRSGCAGAGAGAGDSVLGESFTVGKDGGTTCAVLD